MSHSDSADHAQHEAPGHVVPLAVFNRVLIALLVLTFLTVAISRLDLGAWNIVGAMVIASIKASLVIAFFMHGKYENRIIWAYIILPFVLLAILIGGVFTDNPFRGDLQPMQVVITK